MQVLKIELDMQGEAAKSDAIKMVMPTLAWDEHAKMGNGNEATEWNFGYGNITKYVIYFMSRLFKDESLFELRNGV